MDYDERDSILYDHFDACCLVRRDSCDFYHFEDSTEFLTTTYYVGKLYNLISRKDVEDVEVSVEFEVGRLPPVFYRIQVLWVQ